LWRPATGVPSLTVGAAVGHGVDRAAFGAGVVGALDVRVLDAVGGNDRVVTAAPEEAVDAGLAEQKVGAAVADQDVVVERSLDVLVGGAEADVAAAFERPRRRRWPPRPARPSARR
jgi:hypothetical protein